MANRLSYPRGQIKAVGHLRFKTSKEQQAKGNRFSFLACAVLALIAAFNFTAQEISNRIVAARTPQGVMIQAPAPTPAQQFSLFASPQTLRIPVDGVAASDLRDTWGEARSEGRAHQGIDIMAPAGTPVRAIADGQIVRFFDSRRGGITIYQADQTGAYIFYYAHLQQRAFGLSEGQFVRQGDVIGAVGQTGNATTPHLHFEIQKMGPEREWWTTEAVNPYPYLLSGEAPR